MSRLARAIAALRAPADPAPAPRVDAIADVLEAIGQELAAINTKLDTIAAAPPAPAAPTRDLTEVWNAIDELAPDAGPFRAHLIGVAERLLRQKGETPETVAATILQGAEG